MPRQMPRKGRPSATTSPIDVDQPEMVETVHRGAGGADAWENDGVGPTHVSAVRRDGDRGAGGFQRASNGAQIAGAIVDDRDGDAHASTPFVDGIVLRVASHAGRRVKREGAGFENRLRRMMGVARPDQIDVGASCAALTTNARQNSSTRLAAKSRPMTGSGISAS